MRRIPAVLLLAIALSPLPAGAATEDEAPTTGGGVVLAGIYSHAWEAAADLNGLGGSGGRRLTFAGTFQDVYESEGLNWAGTTRWILDQAWLGRATPVANVHIADTALAIAGGGHDTAITAWAQRVKAWTDQGDGRSLLIAPLQEMNGDWVPYGVDPAAYRAAYRRFVTLARQAGLDETRVRWVFAPSGWSTPPYRIGDYYPGQDVVDFLGISAYNWGAALGGWAGVTETISGPLAELRHLAPDKPFLLTQVGSASDGGDRDAWVDELFRVAADDPNLVGLVYFNFDKETDWRVWDGDTETVAPGWALGMGRATTRYVWPLTGWFQPGPLDFDAPLPPLGFTDTGESPYRWDIAWLAGRGITQGCDPGLFCPLDSVTREQMASLLVRAFRFPPTETDWFGDDDASIHQADINALAEGGVTSGCAPGEFCPRAVLTREETASLLVRALRLPPSSLDRFSDDTGSPYQADIDALAAAGLTIGCDIGRFCPQAEMTREQVVAFLYRALNR